MMLSLSSFIVAAVQTRECRSIGVAQSMVGFRVFRSARFKWSLPTSEEHVSLSVVRRVEDRQEAAGNGPLPMHT